MAPRVLGRLAAGAGAAEGPGVLAAGGFAHPDVWRARRVAVAVLPPVPIEYQAQRGAGGLGERGLAIPAEAHVRQSARRSRGGCAGRASQQRGGQGLLRAASPARDWVAPALCGHPRREPGRRVQGRLRVCGCIPARRGCVRVHRRCQGGGAEDRVPRRGVAAAQGVLRVPGSRGRCAPARAVRRPPRTPPHPHPCAAEQRTGQAPLGAQACVRARSCVCVSV
mmetsp:Transcript_3343/g.13793  ORF Transcript_3343/g.13793 Transcript_3343/m.13793 type:complete len:223 (+) Transcript_3343:1312-1980(+)